MRLLLGLLLCATIGLADDIRTKIDHIIVIYLENRSFDNLFRGFAGADTSDKPLVPYAPQSDAKGVIYPSLCMGDNAIALGFPPKIPNAPFLLDDYVTQDKIIPDLVHRFFQNKLQINSGTNNRFVNVSDEKALSMGYHDMTNSALWRYAREFTLCDQFFAAAYGGSFLNHQWLIAARTPQVGLENNLSVYELDGQGEIVKDGILTPDGYAVNTIQPFHPPFKAKYSDPALRLPPQTHDTIGDRLSNKKISWGWYSGGYDEAIRGLGDDIHYQYHHNPFLYFENYKPNSRGREHLKDEKEFFREIQENRLPHVVFFKPSAVDNQHPGYASITTADLKLEQIVETIRNKPKLWEKTLIIVTYDENGGLWDHVSPPAPDRWGMGTRIPALVISPHTKKGFVDHTIYDTTSILRLIEWRFGLEKIGVRTSNNMLNALKVKSQK